MAELNNSINDTIISNSNAGAINNIYNTGDNVTIYGNDRGIYIVGSDTGIDYIDNSGRNAVIYAKSKNDTVVNRGDGTLIDTGDDSDRVTNYGRNTTIYSGYGNDTITTYGEGTQITLGTGSNSVNAFANNVVVRLSRGNQTIQSKAGTGTSIEGGVSDDNITIQQNGTGSGVVATINTGVGDDVITGSDGAEVFVYAEYDGNDVIYGWSSNDTLVLTSGSISETMIDGSDVVIAVGYDSITLKDAAGQKINIGSPGSDTNETSVTLASTFTGTYEADDVVRKIDASKVTKSIEIYGNSLANTITGGKGNDEIYGDDGNDKLSGGAGNDTLSGGSGNDTLTGGAGADVFIYESGRDVITDYKASQNDKIQLGVSTMTTSVSGQNVILKVGSGQITVNNAKSQKVSVIGSNGRTTVVGSSSTSTSSGGTASLPSGVTYTNNRKTLTVKSPFTGTIDLAKYASTVTVVDASTNTKFTSIKGTSRAETLKASKGGSVLTGGKGNDKLYGASGFDIFNYASGDGKDTIYNYGAGKDIIRITSGTISKASISGSNVVLTIGSGSITVNNAKGKDIIISDSSGEIKTYNFTNTVTNPTKSFTERSGFEERWFIDDNTSVTPIDSILQTSDNEYSVGEIDSKNPLKKSLDTLTLAKSKK